MYKKILVTEHLVKFAVCRSYLKCNQDSSLEIKVVIAVHRGLEVYIALHSLFAFGSYSFPVLVFLDNTVSPRRNVNDV